MSLRNFGPRSGLSGSKRLLLAVALVAQLALFPNLCFAQTRSTSYPNDQYWAGFRPYFDGDYQDAAKTFRRAGQAGYIGVNGRWIDSICYHTMLGECFYRTGDLADALAQYDTALQVVVADSQWWSNVEFPAAIQPSASQAPARITWGSSARATSLPTLPSSMSILVGQLEPGRALQQGGVVEPARLRQFDVIEVARCTALAIRRRNEILGPIAKFDPFNAQLSQALERSGLAGNHWASPLVAIPLAFTLQGAGQLDEAAALLEQSLQFANRFDHPLTGMALIELGRIRAAQEKWDESQFAFLEATYSGAAFENSDIVEEGFRGATIVHLIRKTPGAYSPLDPAATWARTQGSRQLQVALPVLAAECALANGESRGALGLLDQAQQQVGRSDIGKSAWGARIAYGRGHAAFQSGNTAAGVAGLATAMQYQRRAGFWLFRLGLVDTFQKAGGISERVADELYTDLLRDPTDQDWMLDPMETLSVVLTPHPGPYERWFQIVVARREIDRAIDIGDRMKRHRFFSTLPMGGRELNFRWMIAAPNNALDNETLQQRQKLLLAYPTLIDWVRKSEAAEAALAALPANPEESSPERREQKQLLDQLAEASVALEAAIDDLSLRRESSRQIFPPARTIEQIQQAMNERQAIWYFIETSTDVFSCFVTKSDYAIEPLSAASKIRPLTSKMFRSMGLVDANAAISGESLASEEWRESLAELRTILLGERKADFWSAFDEVVIVPDGMLWYLPFETLPTEADSTTPLIDAVAVRYAPTLGSAVSFRSDVDVEKPMGVVIGKLFPRDEPEVAEAVFEKLLETHPNAVGFRNSLPAPSPFAAGLCSRWLVLDDLEDRPKSPYAWTPLPSVRGRSDATLEDWMALPWRGADTLLLPGFHTAADNGLRGNADGQEVFLAACSLMASGTRTAVLSRWRMSGDSSAQLMHKFLDPDLTGSAASRWRSSVAALRIAPLDASLEPRLEADRTPFPDDHAHPVFWSGYFVLDDGRMPDGAAAPGAMPAPGLPGLDLPGLKPGDAPAVPAPGVPGAPAAPAAPGIPGGAPAAVPGGAGPTPAGQAPAGNAPPARQPLGGGLLGGSGQSGNGPLPRN